MLIHSYTVSLLEFPDEIALCLNISNCPCRCKGCSEKFLRNKIGTEATTEYIYNLLNKFKNKGITLVGFMGGDSYIEDIKTISKYIKENFSLKVGFYSGRDYIDTTLLGYLDYYKYGRWIQPEGAIDNWCTKSCGPINFPWSNQRMYKIENNKLIDITELFRKDPLGDLSRYIIEED